MFTLVDLMNDPVKGSYYCEQLKQAQDPTSNDYWTIEKVLKKRKRNGQEEQLVKFLWYPGYCLRKKVAMNFFSTDFTYQFLQHISFFFKYKYYKSINSLNTKTFDFKYNCYLSEDLRNSCIFKLIKKYHFEKYFKIVCKHYYFYKFGPKLNNICTRRIKLLRKNYTNKKPKKRCCDSLILITHEEWHLPYYKKWNSTR